LVIPPRCLSECNVILWRKDAMYHIPWSLSYKSIW
jgi:hypothetical protein